VSVKTVGLDYIIEGKRMSAAPGRPKQARTVVRSTEVKCE
jgi:hypothetical protein